MEVVLANADAILKGLIATILLNATGFSAGAVAGALLALPLRSDRRLLWWPARAYVELIRNTPFLIQAMILFAVLGVMRIRVDPYVPGAAVIALYTAGYMAEIVRGGLASVPTGQWETAAALGLRPLATLRLVVLPQTLPFVLPASVNLAATVLKESAALAAVAVAELTYVGQVIIGRTFAAFEVWATVGVLYLSVVLGLIGLANRLERHLAWASGGLHPQMKQGSERWKTSSTERA